MGETVFSSDLELQDVLDVYALYQSHLMAKDRNDLVAYMLLELVDAIEEYTRLRMIRKCIYEAELTDLFLVSGRTASP